VWREQTTLSDINQRAKQVLMMKKSKKVLEQQFQEVEVSLISIKRRLYFLLAFEKALQEVTRGKPFQVRNDVIFRQMIDVWDMLVVDLSSFCSSMVSKGGFFNQLRSALSEFKLWKKKKISAEVQYLPSEDERPEDIEESKIRLEEIIRDRMHQARLDRLHELFPNLKVPSDPKERPKVRAEDVDDLKKKFSDLVATVCNDRNRNRAHRYERSENGTSERLNFDKLQAKIKEIEGIFNGLRLITQGSHLSYSSQNSFPADTTARDLVFLILWGNIDQLDYLSGVTDAIHAGGVEELEPANLRNKFVSRMHKVHDQLQKKIEKDSESVPLQWRKAPFNVMHGYESMKKT
jgi:hypothetical protein